MRARISEGRLRNDDGLDWVVEGAMVSSLFLILEDRFGAELDVILMSFAAPLIELARLGRGRARAFGMDT